jgi:hypothetical protein
MPFVSTKNRQRDFLMKQRNNDTNKRYILQNKIKPRQREFDTLNDLMAYLKCGIGKKVNKKSGQVDRIELFQDLGFDIVLIKFNTRRDDISIWYYKNSATDKMLYYPFFPDSVANIISHDINSNDGKPSERLTLFCEKIDQCISKMYES